MKKVELSQGTLETAYTALRLELARNWGKDPEIVKQLQKALEELSKAM